MKKLTTQALTTLLAVLLLLALMAGCSQKSAYPAEEYSEEWIEEPAEEPAAEAVMDGGYYSEDSLEDYNLKTYSASTNDTDVSGETTTKNKLAEKIIYSGYVHVETTEFDSALQSIDRMVEEFGGFIESSEVNGETRYNNDGSTTMIDRYAYYVLRVPSASFNAAMKRSGSIGNVISSNTVADNITSQFTDAEARKASLEVQQERLLAMLEKTEDVESLIELESRLSEVRYELESIERQLINWQNSVDYSTVKISLTEVAVFTPVAPVTQTFGEKLGTAFSDGWNGFKSFLKSFILWFARSLPTLVILAIIGVAIWLIVRKCRRRYKEKHQPKVYARVLESTDQDSNAK